MESKIIENAIVVIKDLTPCPHMIVMREATGDSSKVLCKYYNHVSGLFVTTVFKKSQLEIHN